MSFDLNSFTLPGYAPEVDFSNPTETPDGLPDQRPSTPAYKIQPVVWIFVTLALVIVGLYLFLEE